MFADHLAVAVTELPDSIVIESVGFLSALIGALIVHFDKVYPVLVAVFFKVNVGWL